MGKVIGYGKLGRSMPLTLEKCGNLGGDVEMVAVVKEMALRHPDDLFLLMGRNTGEKPADVGLPSNVQNPWVEWGPELKARVASAGLKGVVLTPERQLELARHFDDIVGPTFDCLDAFVMWVGQHGTSNTPIPTVADRDKLTKPQDWCAWYSGFMLRGINRWRDVAPMQREEICLNADARNRHKMRDMKWPLRHPVLAQFAAGKALKHERYGAGLLGFDDFRDAPDTVHWPRRWSDALGYENFGEVWHSEVRDVYARLEVNGLRPGTPFGDLISYDEQWARPGDFGLFINEARSIGIRPELQRKTIFRKWIDPLEPYFVHGSWSEEGKRMIGREIKPAPWSGYYPALHSVRTTFTTPSSGSGWATAKPWEAFAAGTVCFFHPEYDTQDNILGDAPGELRNWLRVPNAATLQQRIKHLSSQAGRDDWYWLVKAQRAHFDRALQELTYMKMIEERIYGQA